MAEERKVFGMDHAPAIPGSGVCDTRIGLDFEEDSPREKEIPVADGCGHPPPVSRGAMALGTLARYKSYRAIRRDEKGNVVDEIVLDGEQYARLLKAIKDERAKASEPEPE